MLDVNAIDSMHKAYEGNIEWRSSLLWFEYQNHCATQKRQSRNCVNDVIKVADISKCFDPEAV